MLTNAVTEQSLCRCKTCQYWNQRHFRRGACMEVHRKDSNAQVKPAGAALITEPDFGCTSWRKKISVWTGATNAIRI